MDGYELRDHRSQQRLRPIGGYFENFYSSVSRISEEIYSQQAVYLSYTSNLAFNLKHSPSPVASEAFDYTPRLIQGETVFRPKTFILAEVEIELTPSEFDPWHEVPVKRLLGGFYSVGDNSMLNDGKVLAEVDPIEFAPYAFLKWERGKL
jgi:hypothetical protein